VSTTRRREARARQRAASERAVRAARVEIARSFAFKLNCGNYESRDFFCSEKAECDIAEADAVSDRLYAFCKTQVMRAVREYQQEVAAQFGPRKAG